MEHKKYAFVVVMSSKLAGVCFESSHDGDALQLISRMRALTDSNDCQKQLKSNFTPLNSGTKRWVVEKGIEIPIVGSLDHLSNVAVGR